MKIALIAGHFMPEIGYQEVQLAKAYAKLGYTLRVFTSNEVSASSRKIVKNVYTTGLHKDPEFGYEILRMPAMFSYNSLIVVKNLKNEVARFNPDFVVIHGIGKIFPLSLYTKSITDKFKVITLLGNNPDMRHSKSLFGNIKYFVVNNLLKRRIYNLATKFSNKIVVYTPSTEKIIKEIISTKYHNILVNKIVQNTLGFDEDIFYFDKTERIKIRQNLKIPIEEIVIISSTRIIKNKNIENNIDYINELHLKGHQVHYIICGFLNDAYEKEVRDYIIKKTYKKSLFYLVPFIGHTELNKYYSASDIGLWTRAAISIQEAMGAGLSVVIPYRESVSHLVKENYNGWYYSDNIKRNDLLSVLEKVVKSIQNIDDLKRAKNREEIINSNLEFLSYKNIAKKIIDDF